MNACYLKGLQAELPSGSNNPSGYCAREFDRRFDAGEDVHDLIEMEKAKIVRHGKKVRLTIDVAESLVKELDEIRQKIGVDRSALIKVWLHERVIQEKTMR